MLPLSTVVGAQCKVRGRKGPRHRHTHYVRTETKMGHGFGLLDKTSASASRESGRRSWLSLPSVLGPSVIPYSL